MDLAAWLGSELSIREGVNFFFLGFYLFFREGGKEGDREGEKQWVVASFTPPTRDLARNLDMCPD